LTFISKKNLGRLVLKKRERKYLAQVFFKVFKFKKYPLKEQLNKDKDFIIFHYVHPHHDTPIVPLYIHHHIYKSTHMHIMILEYGFPSKDPGLIRQNMQGKYAISLKYL